MKTILILVTASSFFLLSCAHAEDNEKEMLSMADALLLVSSSVESVVRYENAPDQLEDEELIKYATKDDPALLRLFENYCIRAKGVLVGQKKHSHLLVCTLDKKQALLEDVGCTGNLDRLSFRNTAPCELTLDVAAICKD